MKTRAYGELYVSQMLSNFRLEGIEPDKADKQLRAAYIDGTATLDDMLAHASQFAAAAAYDQWFREQVQEAIDDARPGIPHDQVMADVQAILDAKRQ
jgi:hypothetical protein